MLSIYLKERLGENAGARWGGNIGGGHINHQNVPKEESPNSESANIILLKQLALRKILLKKKKKKNPLIEILFCKHIKNYQISNILNVHKKCAQMGNFSIHISLGKKSFIIKLKVLEFFKLNCASVS